MVTTPANKIQSRQLRSAILAALTSDVAAHFDTHTDLVDNDFEMVAVLWETNTPIGNLALLANFAKMFQLEMDRGYPLATYMSSIHTTIGLLCDKGIENHPILINLFALKGLNGAYEPFEQDFDIRSKQLTGLTLEQIECKCGTYASTTQNIQSDDTDAASAAAKASSTPPLLPPPASKTLVNPGNTISAYPH